MNKLKKEILQKSVLSIVTFCLSLSGNIFSGNVLSGVSSIAVSDTVLPGGADLSSFKSLVVPQTSVVKSGVKKKTGAKKASAGKSLVKKKNPITVIRVKEFIDTLVGGAMCKVCNDSMIKFNVLNEYRNCTTREGRASVVLEGMRNRFDKKLSNLCRYLKKVYSDDPEALEFFNQVSVDLFQENSFDRIKVMKKVLKLLNSKGIEGFGYADDMRFKTIKLLYTLLSAYKNVADGERSYLDLIAQAQKDKAALLKDVNKVVKSCDDFGIDINPDNPDEPEYVEALLQSSFECALANIGVAFDSYDVLLFKNDDSEFAGVDVLEHRGVSASCAAELFATYGSNAQKIIEMIDEKQCSSVKYLKDLEKK